MLIKRRRKDSSDCKLNLHRRATKNSVCILIIHFFLNKLFVESQQENTVDDSSVECLDAVVESQSYAGETHLSLESRGKTSVQAPATTLAQQHALNNIAKCPPGMDFIHIGLYVRTIQCRIYHSNSLEKCARHILQYFFLSHLSYENSVQNFLFILPI